MLNRPAVSPNRMKVACLALAITAFALPGKLGAASQNQIAISYEVEVGSMSAMHIAYKATLSDTAYQSTASIKTKGLASMFSDYQMDMTSSGAFDGEGLKPQHYRSKADKKNAEKVLEVSWPSEDPPAVKTTPRDKEDEALLAPALTTGLVDPLSMLLRMTALQAGKPCQSVERVVDGREVYELRFALAGEVKLGKDSPGAYRGPAFKCSMTYTPVGGRPAVKYKKRGGVPSKFDIWFAPVKSGASDEALFVPVLATGRLQGLRFIAYARKASIGGQSIAGSAD
ncbi:DUF3108 domain-containing protein [Taklimakanibacter deserti]|uniref:DUF3108 domain-containing protein n=1 Tax=Taklimakanibacter deserti TaxID=2267839 RepID=UPI0013C44972